MPSYRVAYDLKGDKNHHEAVVEEENLTIEQARQTVLLNFRQQRIVRALVLIDCLNLPGPDTTKRLA